MSRKKDSAVETSPPTRPRPVDAFGFELDAWGLPINGPERIRRLALAGRRDPDRFPEDWAEGGGAPVVTRPAALAATPEEPDTAPVEPVTEAEADHG